MRWKEQEFEEITKISRTASNSGGVTKYTAEVTIPKEESMLAGDESPAVITIERKNVLTLSQPTLYRRGETEHSSIWKPERMGCFQGKQK